MIVIPAIDVDRAQIGRQPGGRVRIDDPDAPYVVTVVVCDGDLRSIAVDLRPGARATLTATTLARLPLGQIRHVAAAAADDAHHPNETYWRSVARPRQPGQRQWPDDHWDRVAQVWRWAQTTGRPGGGFQAIVDLWHISRATAYRWQAHLTSRNTDM